MFSLIRQKLNTGLDLFLSSPERLLHFSIANALRPYLKDELQQDQLTVMLLEGLVKIGGGLNISEQVTV